MDDTLTASRARRWKRVLKQTKLEIGLALGG
jgi:hypothetical protein